MAAYDIMPWNSSHGGHERVVSMEIGAADFVIGEPVVTSAAGTVSLAATDAGPLFVGIATGPQSYQFRNSSGGQGTGTASTQDFRTRINIAVGASIPIWVADDSTLFVSERYSEDDSGAVLTVPTLATIGNNVALMLNSGNWGFDAAATATHIGNVVDVLDANNNSLSEPGAGAGAKVVVKFYESFWNTSSGLDAV